MAAVAGDVGAIQSLTARGEVGSIWATWSRRPSVAVRVTGRLARRNAGETFARMQAKNSQQPTILGEEREFPWLSE